MHSPLDMSLLSLFLSVLLVRTLALGSTTSLRVLDECIHAPSKMYNGYYEFEPGIIDVVPFHSSVESSRNICNMKCMAIDICFATSINDMHVCSFYNTSNFVVSVDSKNSYSLWKKCKMTNIKQPLDGRCKGLWITYFQQWATVESYSYLENVTMEVPFARSVCQDKCLKNRFCGSVNLNKTRCFLVPKWPWDETHYNKNNDVDAKMDNWTCIDDYIETFNISVKETQPIVEKCTGYWLLSARNAKLTCPKEPGVLFHTQVYSECLAECEQHPTCFRVYYNLTYSVCVLDCIQRTDHHLNPPDMTFMEFKWVCTKNDSIKSPMNAEEKRMAKLGMKCLKIVTVKDLFIAMDMCGTCPPKEEFSKCDEEFDIDSDWKIRDSCRVNQSYWAFPSEKIQLNITGYGVMNVTRVFTGLAHYCLAYQDADNLISADYLECRTFNASRDMDKLDSREIVTQKEWQHQPPIGKIYPFSKIPTKVVITASQQPLHSCRTKAAGIDLIRWIQVILFRGAGRDEIFSDVPYNFYVDQNGNIYEGRGWKFQSQDVNIYNNDTIAIGFIGWFKFELPTERFLNSVKKLVEFGVDHNYIDREYTLYTKQDLVTSYIHRNLIFVIRNWYRYRGFIPPNCSSLSSFNSYFILFATIIYVILFYAFYRLCFFSFFCKNCRFLSLKDMSFEKVFPLNTSSTELDEMFITSHSSKVVYIIHERFPETPEKIDYVQLVSLVKALVYSTFLDTSSLHCNGYSLSNSLCHYSLKNTECRILEADLISYKSVVSADEKVIACVASTGSSLFLRNLIKAKSCICTYYKVERIDRNEVNRALSDCVVTNVSYKRHTNFNILLSTKTK